jgi:hypothetical protein
VSFVHKTVPCSFCHGFIYAFIVNCFKTGVFYCSFVIENILLFNHFVCIHNVHNIISQVMFINLCIMMYSYFIQICIKFFNIFNAHFAPSFGTIQNEMVVRSFATGSAINVIHISLSITSSSFVLFFDCQHNCICTCRYITLLSLSYLHCNLYIYCYWYRYAYVV